MTAPAQTIHLLILTSRPDEAERLVTSLRNGGLAVRGVYTHQPERIEELIEARPCEMILCCIFDPSIDLPAVLARYNELHLDIPLVIVADGDSEPDVLIQALRAGARDLTERDDIEHLQLVITREIEDLHNRRTLVRLRNRLQQCESRAKEQVESSAEAVALIHEGMHVHANPAYQRLFRFDSIDDLDGYPLLDVVAPEHHQAVRTLLRSRDMDPSDATTEIQIQCIRADSSRFQTRMGLSRADLDGEPCLRVVIQPFDNQAVAVAEEAADGVDGHRGLPDLGAFIAVLSRRLSDATDPSRPLALLYVGIRGFDELLATEGLTRTLELSDRFASNLQQILPEQCYLARIGERGFVVMAEDLDAESAERLAAEIRDGASLPLASRRIGAHDPDCDIGLLVADTSQSSATELLDVTFLRYLENQASVGPTEQPADAKPARPSAAEREPAHPAVVADHPEDAEIAARIDRALETNRFKLVYQPIISLMGDQQENYSVLLRMLDDEQDLHETEELIGPAVRTGRMEALDRWITRRAIEEVTEQRKNGHKVNLFINLPENSYAQESLLIHICDCIQELEARGNWLTFQFQQEQARIHLAELTRLIEGLKKIKCRIALSHFDDSDKPDLLLQSLPVDLVLFNPNLAHGLAEDGNKQKRLQYLTKLAREFNVKSVVTGVEDARSLTVLWTSGIDYVQGNFLQRPSPTLAIES